MQEKRQEHFYNIGVSYKKADANTRGKFSLSKENQRSILQLAKEKGLQGLFVLSTCNRTEIFGFAERPCQLIELLCEFSEGSIQEFAIRADAENMLAHIREIAKANYHSTLELVFKQVMI